jgi:hypothetical protein
MIRDYLCNATWSLVVAKVPRWPHDDPIVAELRESIDLRWQPSTVQAPRRGAAAETRTKPQRALREPVCEAFVWDVVREKFDFMDVRHRSFKFCEIKLSVRLPPPYSPPASPRACTSLPRFARGSVLISLCTCPDRPIRAQQWMTSMICLTNLSGSLPTSLFPIHLQCEPVGGSGGV